jgi:pyruvate dehydrogenase E2 component (dihydrolipoamide acetyltransferase)
MSVSVSMPQLGESVTEGTVTRWLKREGEHVNADEPLLEVSTDKVDTEIPSPVSGVLRGITVAEDETVAVGAQLAVIDEEGSAAGSDSGQAASGPGTSGQAEQAPEPQAQQQAQPPQAQPQAQPDQAGTAPYQQPSYPPPPAQQPAYQQTQAWTPPPPAPPAYPAPSGYQPQPGYPAPPARPDPYQYQPQPGYQAQPGYQQPYEPQPQQPGYQQPGTNPYQPAAEAPSYPPAPPAGAPAPGGHPYQGDVGPGQYGPGAGQDEAAQAPEPPAENGSGYANGAENPYVTPLVRKLAAENGIDLARVTGTGVGGRIRKQDVLDAARSQRGEAAAAPAAQAPAQAPAGQAPAAPAPAQAPPAPAQQAAAQPAAPQPAGQPAAYGPAADAPQARPSRTPVPESALRGTTERMSRARQVIAQRMVESLQTSAQLTTVVEADVTAIARLRERAKAAFEAREGVKLSFLPFFALAAVESLKAHPKLNAVIDTASGQVTYHADEHLGIAVDTERGLMVPVIRKAGDLNIAGLARKIADLATRTRAGQVSPDDLAGGTFTLTNTGSRGALFDTPIINQPQVGILGTGTVVKRAIVVEDPALGEVITVRSMVYLALTYDHRLVDGADAARFLTTLKARLEEGAYETELGL